MDVMRDMNRITSQEVNPLPPKFKAGVLTTEPHHSLVCHYKYSCIKSYHTFSVDSLAPS